MAQNLPGLRSPIKFRDIHFIDIVTDIKCGEVQGDRSVGEAMILMSILICHEVKSLDVTWWPDIERPGSEIFTCGKDVWPGV